MPNLHFFGPHHEIQQRSRKSAFDDVFRKMSRTQNRGGGGGGVVNCHGKSTNGQGKVKGNYFVKSVGTLLIHENSNAVLG